MAAPTIAAAATKHATKSRFCRPTPTSLQFIHAVGKTHLTVVAAAKVATAGHDAEVGAHALINLAGDKLRSIYGRGQGGRVVRLASLRWSAAGSLRAAVEPLGAPLGHAHLEARKLAADASDALGRGDEPARGGMGRAGPQLQGTGPADTQASRCSLPLAPLQTAGL